MANNIAPTVDIDFSVTAQGAARLANTATASTQDYTKIVALTGGRYVVTWLDQSHIGGDPTANAVKGRIFDSFGAPIGGEFLVNTNTSGNQHQQEMVALTGGGFVVTYVDSSSFDGNGNAVLAQRFDSSGAKVGSEFLVNTTSNGNQNNAFLTALANGGFAITWFDSGTGSDGSLGSIKLQVYNAAGARVGGEVLVNTATSGDQTNLFQNFDGQQHQTTVMATLSNGDFVVTWRDFSLGVGGAGGDTDGTAIKAQRFDSSGTKLGSEFRVNTQTSGAQTLNNVTGLVEGNFVVAWSDANGDGTGNGSVKAQVYTNAGATVGSEIAVNTTTAGNQTNPALARLANGGFVIAWQDGTAAIRAQLFDASGTKIGSEFTVNADNSGTQTYPVIASLAGGGFAISWTDGNDGGSEGIRAQEFTAGGVKVGAEVLVNSTVAGHQELARIAALANGGYAISWSDGGAAYANIDVYTRALGEGGVQAVEQVAVSLKGGITIGDVDAGAGTISVVLAVSTGILNVTGGGSGAAVSNSGTNFVTLTGTLAQINALLRTDATSTVSFTANTDNPPASVTLTVTANDNGNTGDGGAQGGSDTFVFSIQGVNDAPTVGANAGLTLDEGAIGTITTPLLDFNDAEQADTAITYTVTSAATNGTLRRNGVTLNVNDTFTQDDINNNLITYFHNGSETTSGSFGFSVSDGTATVAGQSFNFTVTPVNDQPIAATTPANPTYTENDSAVALFSAVVATPIESGQTFTSLTLTVTNVTDGAAELLTIDGSSVTLTSGTAVTTAISGLNVTVLTSGSTATVTFTGATLSAAALQSLVMGLGYRNASENPTDANRVVTITELVDSGSNVAPNDNTAELSLSSTVDVNPANDAPAPGANTGLTLNEGAGATITGAMLDYNDAEQADTAIVYTVTSAATNGTLRLNGVAIAQGGTFTPDDINNNRITFLHSDSETTSASFGFSVSDGAGGSVTSQSFAITVTAVNDAPILNGLGTPQTMLDAQSTLVLSGSNNLSGYVPANDFILAGSTTLTGFAAWLADNARNDDGVFSSFSGTLSWAIYADAGASPGALLYNGQDNTPQVSDSGLQDDFGSDIFRVGIDFPSAITLGAGTYWLALHEGAWGSARDGTTVWWQHTTQSSAGHKTSANLVTPSAWGNAAGAAGNAFLLVGADPSPAITFAENTVNATPQIIDGDVSFGDAEGNLNGGSLVVSGLLAEDSVAIRIQGTNAGQIGVSGSDVTYGGAIIGTFIGGAGNDLTVTLNAAATSAAVDALIQNLTYANASDIPTASRTLTITVTDAGNASTAGSITVNVTAENDAPDEAVNAGLTLDEGTSTAITPSELEFDDPDQQAADTAMTYTVTTLAANGEVRLNGAPLGLNGTFTQDDVNNGRVTYLHNGSETASDSFGFTVSDGDGEVAAGRTFAITVTPVNDAPALTVQDATVSGAEDTNLVFNAAGSNAITVADVDDASLTVTLTVLNGALTLFQTSGLSFGTGDGTGDATMTFTGSAADVNAALEGLVYRGALNYDGADTLSVLIDDGDDTDGEDIAITLADDGKITGDAGDNPLSGTPGPDSFRLEQGGDDTVDGGDGNDGFFFGAAFTGADTVDGGDGTNDQIGLQGDYTGGNALMMGPDTITNVEVIALLPGFDYDVTMVDANVPGTTQLTIFGGNLGAGDNLTFNGSAETAGSFKIYGGLGTDLITTGGGNDAIYFGPNKFDPTNDQVDGGSGANDQLALDGDYTATLTGTAIQNIDVLALLKGIPGDFNDFDLTLDASLLGLGQAMTIWGVTLQTDLTIDGSAVAGDLKLYGGGFSDRLSGGSGNDWFWGGADADYLNGGGGADTFVYDSVLQSSAAGFDTLIDFDDSVDKIDLPNAVTSFAGPTSGVANAANLGADLEAANGALGLGQAVVFTAAGGDMDTRVFLLVNANGATGYQATGDFLIELVTPVSPVDQIGMFI